MQMTVRLPPSFYLSTWLPFLEAETPNCGSERKECRMRKATKVVGFVGRR